jgi:hypothetical protein
VQEVSWPHRQLYQRSAFRAGKDFPESLSLSRVKPWLTGVRPRNGSRTPLCRAAVSMRRYGHTQYAGKAGSHTYKDFRDQHP